MLFALNASEKVKTISSLKYSEYEKTVSENGEYAIIKSDKVLKAGGILESDSQKFYKVWFKRKSKKDKQGYIRIEKNSKLKLTKKSKQRKDKIWLFCKKCA